jgi:hypothetical protein
MNSISPFEFQKQKAEQFELIIKALAFDIAKKIGTTNGFMEYYFTILHKCNTQTQAFETVNLLHYLVFGKYKYSEIQSFRNSRKKYLKR